MQDAMYNPDLVAEPPQQSTLQRVPPGYHDLEAGNFAGRVQTQ